MYFVGIKQLTVRIPTQMGMAQQHQQHLVMVNIGWLNQALDLLASLDNHTFTAIPVQFAPHRTSSHLRHILEFYECFLLGLESGVIDYDGRRRDVSIERDLESATHRIRSIIAQLSANPRLATNARLGVRLEDAQIFGLADNLLPSSIGRELQVLSSHTVHHFALMALTLRALGVDVDPKFGMAPSTLRYLAANPAREAA